MPSTAIQADIMIALVLASDPGQVGITRCLVRAALDYRGLGHYAPEAETIASELLTNAIQHARSTDPTDKIGVTLMRLWVPGRSQRPRDTGSFARAVTA